MPGPGSSGQPPSVQTPRWKQAKGRGGVGFSATACCTREFKRVEVVCVLLGPVLSRETHARACARAWSASCHLAQRPSREASHVRRRNGRQARR